MFGIKCKPKNLTESLLPILTFNWIFGHQMIRYSASGFNFAQKFLYLIFIISIYGSILTYIALWYSNSAHTFNNNVRIYFLVVLVNFLILAVNIFFGRFYRNRACIINKKISKIDKSLEYLGVPVNRQQSYNYSLKLIVIWIISVFILNIIVALLSSVQIKGFLRKIMMAFIIQHPMHVNALIDFTFCSLILLMKLRFKSVNEALLKFRIIYSYNLPVINLNREVNNHFTRQKTPEHSFVVFKILKNAHLELTNICNDITEIFECQLIMTILSSFILITTMLYNVYSSNVNEEITFIQKVSYSIIFTSWVLHSSFKFIFINYTCSGTICEWKRTGKLIHKLEIKSHGTDFSEEIQRFSIQIIKNPLIFTPCGLINLSYKLIRNFAGSITTYLVIVIQLSDEDNH
ncbi:GSCOCT00014045001.2-RA-CDS [Cotesia congregata]|uniref:Gustatory receptor n=1 Tax=Cotesia congregata TaxID=51543 RepID=A0A8J2HKA9_COTCN|nr:GSCOCT00014045001.2-RA-CDS [Cotesia congregata]CAG5101818.1 gustatory receptor 29 [Cotesia congregata]